jgi:hypothetical protein
MRNTILALTLLAITALAAPRNAAAQISLHLDRPGFSLHAGPPRYYGPPVVVAPPAVAFGPPVYYRPYYYKKHKGRGHWKHWHKHHGWRHGHGDWDDD